MTLFLPPVQRLWFRIHEPRLVSLLRFVMYNVLLSGAVSIFIVPPTSLEGEIGSFAMYSLAVLLAFGSILGVGSVLQGAWYVERIAVLSIMAAFAIYAAIIITLQMQPESGNRLLQLSAVLAVILSHAIRLARIWERPYDPKLKQTI